MASSNKVSSSDLEAKAEWVGVLLQLWDVIGKTPDKKQLMVYINELGIIPIDILKQVISNLLSTRIYHTIPTIGEVWTETRTWFARYYGILWGDKSISIGDIYRLKKYCRDWKPDVSEDGHAEVE